jgi:pilus assembly protein CpaC
MKTRSPVRPRIQASRFGVALFFAIFGVTGAEPPSAELGSAFSLNHAVESVVAVPVNKSRVLDLARPALRVSVGNPDIADILVLRSRQLYIVGKALGTTNVVLWDGQDRVQHMLSIEVTHDLQTLKEKLHHLLPQETINVGSSQGTLVLSGEVSSPVKMDAALRLAESFAPKTKDADKDEKPVLNLMQLGGAQQVLLEVKVAEMARTLVRRMNINFNPFFAGSDFKLGAVGGGASFPDAIIADPFLGEVRVPMFADGQMWGPALPEFSPDRPGITDKGIFASYLSGDFLFEMVVDAAKDRGLAKILAEPNLTTLSGQQAKFLAGGEFPVPVPQDFGTIAIEYKEFGVGLQFVPVVLDSGVINLKLNVTVSELQPTNSLTLDLGNSGQGASQGFFVPGLAKRSASSTVELKSGQTIAIAGLINERLRENVDKLPGLGDLPVLGMLFRSQEYTKGETELVIFVTPRLARPVEPADIRLPTDDFVDPSDTAFYLLGRLEGRRPTDDAVGTEALRGGSEGRFGHDL